MERPIVLFHLLFLHYANMEVLVLAGREFEGLGMAKACSKVFVTEEKEKKRPGCIAVPVNWDS